MWLLKPAEHPKIRGPKILNITKNTHLLYPIPISYTMEVYEITAFFITVTFK